MAGNGIVTVARRVPAFFFCFSCGSFSMQMLALVRQDWMGLRCMLPQLLEAMGKAEEAENLLRQVLHSTVPDGVKMKQVSLFDINL